MLLIADSGSTKTDWALTEPGKQTQEVYHTAGFNPYFIKSEAIYQILSESLARDLDLKSVTELYFYGAGCSTDEHKDTVRRALLRLFPNVKDVFVGHDLLGAARALLGHEPGFAAILGTGANTALYDGKEITLNIDSLGYLLGDEGSGSYIGKKLLRDYMRGRLQPELQQRFKERFAITDNEQIFHTLYSTEFPNRYLSEFCKFADEFIDHPYIRNKVRDSFKDFFKNLVSKYPDYKNYSFNCIGSVGFIFKDILQEVSVEYDMKPGRFLRSPLEDLVGYHINI